MRYQARGPGGAAVPPQPPPDPQSPLFCGTCRARLRPGEEVGWQAKGAASSTQLSLAKRVREFEQNHGVFTIKVDRGRCYQCVEKASWGSPPEKKKEFKELVAQYTEEAKEEKEEEEEEEKEGAAASSSSATWLGPPPVEEEKEEEEEEEKEEEKEEAEGEKETEEEEEEEELSGAALPLAAPLRSPLFGVLAVPAAAGALASPVGAKAATAAELPLAAAAAVASPAVGGETARVSGQVGLSALEERLHRVHRVRVAALETAVVAREEAHRRAPLASPKLAHGSLAFSTEHPYLGPTETLDS